VCDDFDHFPYDVGRTVTHIHEMLEFGGGLVCQHWVWTVDSFNYC